jgi:hypothetical protein
MTSRRVQVLLCVIACLGLEEASAAGLDAQPIATLRKLSPEAVEGEPAVRVRGVVTWRDDWNFVLQEGDGGIFVNFYRSRKRGLIQDASFLDNVIPGVEVEVEGRLVPAGFAPALLPTAIRVIGSATTPQWTGTHSSSMSSERPCREPPAISSMPRCGWPASRWPGRTPAAN